MTKPGPKLATVRSYRIVSALVALSLAGVSAFADATSIVLYDSNTQSESIVAACDPFFRCERPRMNELGEIVWTQRLEDETAIYGIFSSERGLITSGYVTRDPDINNSGEVIWRFGDGGNGTNGIGSSVRGIVLLSSGIDPYYDTSRINNNGEIIAGREAGGARVWSTVRGHIPVSSDIVRETEVNDSGEVVYEGRTGIFSTARGLIQAGLAYTPDINNHGEIVWYQTEPYDLRPKWEIWSNVRGRIGDGQFSSINDPGEIVWAVWDGTDYEIFSSIRGQLTSNNAQDEAPRINNSGDIVWLRDASNFVPEPSTVAFAFVGALLVVSLLRHRPSGLLADIRFGTSLAALRDHNRARRRCGAASRLYSRIK